MKNAKIFIISVASILSLCACGKAEAPDKIKFNEIGSTCMVPAKVKEYIDAMKEQEKRLEHPYRISSLFGPEDFGWQETDIDDGVEAKVGGGVDVCDYINRTDFKNKLNPVNIEISWDKGEVEYDEATLYFSTNKDMSDAREVAITGGATTASLENLYRATKYYYQLDTGSYKSHVYSFDTDDYPRLIFCDKINNVRDLGGYDTAYGVKTNQGLVYRGMEINSKSFNHSGNHDANVTDKLLEVQNEILQIGKEIDLRADNATDGTNECHLVGNPGDQEARDAYERLTVIAYDDFVNNSSSTAKYARIFEILANADQEHVYFHCWGGADRTGMVAFFLNAILGVSYTDLVIDFELTSATNNRRCHMHNSNNAHFPKFLHAFTTYANYDANKTLNENCERFLLDKGVTKENIEKIRTNFLPGYKASTTYPEPAIA